MGQIFGINGCAEPPYTTVWKCAPVEIRHYEPYFVAEVPMKLSADKADNKAFMLLASYIGVFGTPKNELKKSLAMTAPVITGPEKIAMTTPVVTGTDHMQFVLPFEYKRIEDIPVPTDDQVKIRIVPAKLIAVNSFSGGYSDTYFSSKLKELYAQLLQEKFVEEGTAGAAKDDPSSSSTTAVPSDAVWSYAQYNPPFTLPFLRRNEVWIDLTEAKKTNKLQDLLSSQEAKHEGEVAKSEEKK